mmetsp:Transcript_17000/g.28850  ORF Transcript_17000/g.28850 Transcript_17000/m.28850 type:complete len:105 (-) Transcript_17000:19-333(-)
MTITATAVKTSAHKTYYAAAVMCCCSSLTPYPWLLLLCHATAAAVHQHLHQLRRLQRRHNMYRHAAGAALFNFHSHRHPDGILMASLIIVRHKFPWSQQHHPSN